MPADDPAKLTRFVKDQYGAFSKIYDACKEYSEKINDVSQTSIQSTDDKTLSVKISTDTGTIDNITEAISTDDKCSISGDVITACSE